MITETPQDSPFQWNREAGEVIFSLDVDGRVTSIDGETVPLLGVAIEILLGSRIADWFSPEDGRRCAAAVESEQSGKSHGALCLERRDGRGWVELILRASAATGLHGLARDSTEREFAINMGNAFPSLIRRVGMARSFVEVAESIIDAADNLLGWDACVVNLYDSERDRLDPVLMRDIVDGRRQDVPLFPKWPSPFLREILAGEGKVICRKPDTLPAANFQPFGDMNRPSASLIFAPLRRGAGTLGLMALHSYSLDAYNERSLHLAQGLADLCGEAIHCVRLEAAMSQTEESDHEIQAETT